MLVALAGEERRPVLGVASAAAPGAFGGVGNGFVGPSFCSLGRRRVSAQSLLSPVRVAMRMVLEVGV